MSLLNIDLGSYSVKFFETSDDRKQIVHRTSHEVIIDQVRSRFPGLSLQEIQIEIMSNYLKARNYEGKINLLLPDEHVTTRYLDLPVNNRKKAEQMIPFQLDENLPYPISNSHYSWVLFKKGNNLSAQVSVLQQNAFADFFNSLKDKEIVPNLITTECYLIQNFIENWNNPARKISKMTEPFCVIDIGHNTSKAYFINRSQVVSNHVSRTAGQVIDEVIAQTYQISRDEAIVYKHENCFFLTEEQYEGVEEDQKEFARLMKQALTPLINDIKRWELGFRVKNGLAVKTIYLTGGTSQINNICNFLSEELNIKVEALQVYDLVKQPKIPFSEAEKCKHTVTYLMALSQKAKIPVGTMLTGPYSTSIAETIPLHSMAFIFSRAAVVVALLLASLFAERFFLSREADGLNKQIAGLLKNPELDISKRDQKELKIRPEKILKIIEKKNKEVRNEVKTAMDNTKLNAVEPLIDLSQKLNANPSVDLQTFESDRGNVQARFSAKQIEALDTLSNDLKNVNLPQAKVAKEGNTLILEYRGM